jgi:hypothetical protein
VGWGRVEVRISLLDLRYVGKAGILMS